MFNALDNFCERKARGSKATEIASAKLEIQGSKATKNARAKRDACGVTQFIPFDIKHMLRSLYFMTVFDRMLFRSF